MSCEHCNPNTGNRFVGLEWCPQCQANTQHTDGSCIKCFHKICQPIERPMPEWATEGDRIQAYEKRIKELEVENQMLRMMIPQ